MNELTNYEISADHVQKAPPDECERIDEALGLKAISIRLPVALLDAYKALADVDGTLYQALMRRVLWDYAKAQQDRVNALAKALRQIKGVAP